jgi:mono/diheme cytochrome c family protein
MHRIYFLITILLFLWTGLGSRISAQEAQQKPMSGKELFIKDRCVRCHTIGRGGFVGPDLIGVANRYSRDDIKKWMENSQEIYQSRGKQPLNEGYPPMPPLGVSPEETGIIADYLIAFKTTVTPKEGGVIEGKIMNKSTEEAAGDIEVTLTAYLGDRETETTKAKTTKLGFFGFKNLSWNRAYTVSLNYKGTEYVTDKLVFDPAEDTKTLDLPVYEPTDKDNDIKVNVNHMILQVSEGAIKVAELMVFHNGAKRVYIGSKEIQDDKREALKFNLPSGAEDIQFLQGLTSESVVRTDHGFADTSSVEPGIRRIIYAYTLPYKSGQNVIERTIDYPTDGFILLVSDTGVKVKVDKLTSNGTVQVAEGRFLQWTGSEISPQTKIRIEISKPILGGDLLKWLAFGVLAILIGAGVVYSFMIKPKEEMKKAASTTQDNSIAKEDLEKERKKLIQEIAELDNKFEAKEIGEEEYKKMRSGKKEKLVGIIRKTNKE